MSRLESQAKAHYFPTPPEVVARVAALIRQANHSGRTIVRLLDPCCGTGAALRQLAQTVGGRTYGIEIADDRYSEAHPLLDHALHSSALGVRIANGSFSCLFLNPPYDYDDEARRLEHAFLTTLTRALCPGGLLVFIIPQRRLVTSARYLAGHYRELACYRFPDDQYEAFHQVVLFGVKRQDPVVDPELQTAVTAWAEAPLPELPPAGNERGGYTLPALEAGAVLFTSQFFDPEEAAREARHAGLWANASLAERIWPPEERRTRPLMPLRRGHLAVLIAAGFLDNIQLRSGDRRLLVKGRTYKVSVPVYSPDPEVEVEREVMRTSVVALDLKSGRVEVIASGGGAADEAVAA
jgi:SAM-dependent methyltransferase